MYLDVENSHTYKDMRMHAHTHTQMCMHADIFPKGGGRGKAEERVCEKRKDTSIREVFLPTRFASGGLKKGNSGHLNVQKAD